MTMYPDRVTIDGIIVGIVEELGEPVVVPLAGDSIDYGVELTFPDGSKFLIVPVREDDTPVTKDGR